MTTLRIASTHLLRNIALGFTAIALLLAATPASAAKNKKVSTEVPAELTTAPRLSPKRLKFGMSPADVARVYRKVIDKDYLEKYQTTEPGIAMSRLDHEVETRKRNFERSLLQFRGVGSKFDGTPLRAEYTYNNGEALMMIERKGRTRHFLFINNQLYKVVDVYPNGKKWGADYAAAVAKLSGKLGVEGRDLPPDPSVGRHLAERDWASDKLHLRLIWWSQDAVAIAYVARDIEARLPELRKGTSQDEKKLDDDVQDVIR